jgi:hypothetical protein
MRKVFLLFEKIFKHFAMCEKQVLFFMTLNTMPSKTFFTTLAYSAFIRLDGRSFLNLAFLKLFPEVEAEL